MKKILAVLLLAFSVSASQGQQMADMKGGLTGDLIEGFSDHSDTTFIINWNFEKGMPAGVTEVGNVSVVSFGGSNVLKVNVEGGGADFMQKTIPSVNEVRLRVNFRLSDADTSGWDDNQYIQIAQVRTVLTNNGSAIILVWMYENQLRWRVFVYADSGALSYPSDYTTIIATDTWYNVELYIKKSTAAGANNGIVRLTIDGIEKASKTDWDNDAVVYNECRIGFSASTLDAIYYIRDVVFWSQEGLP